jgi:N4-gp56 family major capsid protein
MATGNIGVTPVDAFIPEIWSKEVIRTASAKSIFSSLVRRDFDGEIREAGDKVHIPLLSAVTTGSKLEDTAVTYTNYSESTKDITIDQHPYFAFRVEDIARVQSKPNLITGYAAQGGSAIALDVDTNLATLIQNAAITQNVGAQASSGAVYGDITDAVIRNAIQLLDEANAPEENRYLVISPAQKNAMLGIAKFVDASQIGDNSVIRTGLFGRIYNVDVYVSNNLQQTASVASVASVASSGGASEIPGVAEVLGHKDCMMFQREAFALCTQISPRVQSEYNLDHLATSVVGDMLYGSGILVPTYAVQVRTTVE